MTRFLRDHTLVWGTLFLTGTGFLSRILGFFYRIFLSRTIGAEGLGIYQMIFPIYGICFSLCAGSIQTAISRFTAANRTHAKRTLLTGFIISFSISLFLACFIWNQAEFLAVHILMEPKCAPLLPALALSIPFTSLHACICGYYYGKESVQFPAIAQVFEQCIRIFAVFLIADIWQSEGRELTAQIAVIGLLLGEIGSALFTLTTFLIVSSRDSKEKFLPSESMSSRILATAGPLMILAAPLMANRLVMNLLQSAEAILIPNQLEQFGLTGTQAVSIYGVMTGMAMPFILFPSAIANSLAVVLLPTVARQQAVGNQAGIEKNIQISFQYSLYMGILCIGIFTVFGETLGLTVFQNRDAGDFITILAWLCPFLYLATTIGSILNGLGKTTATFLNHFCAMLLRLLFVIFGIPTFGIYACLWGMLASEILLVLLHVYALKKVVCFSPNMWNDMIKPTFCVIAALFMYRLLPDTFVFASGLPTFVWTVIQIVFVCVCYLLLLLLFRSERRFV